MLDEWMEQKVDEACEVVPAYVNPRKIRLASSHIGWRLYLYGSSMKRAVSGFFVHIRSEQDMDIFLRETAGKKQRHDHQPYQTVFRGKSAAAGGARRRGAWASVCDDTFLFGLCGAGNAGRRRLEMALCALAACLMLSAAMEFSMSRFAPAFGQRYLPSVRFGRWR